MKFTQRLSLRVRLTLIFLILASVTWLSSFVAWKQTTDNVDELFDTQLMLFAQTVKYARSQRNQRGGSHGTDAK